MTTRIKGKTLDSALGKKYDAMMGRCYRPTDTSYKAYGLKGIRVCSEWIKNIDSFRKWAKEELSRKGISEEYFLANTVKCILDRKDPLGHYTPDNCTFVGSQESSRNVSSRKKTVIVSAEGEEICI